VSFLGSLPAIMVQAIPDAGVSPPSRKTAKALEDVAKVLVRRQRRKGLELMLHFATPHIMAFPTMVSTDQGVHPEPLLRDFPWSLT